MKTGIPALVISALLLTGCATSSTKQPDVNIQSSKAVKITNVTVKQTETDVKVSGTLRPNTSVVTRVGHVDVEFIADDGSVLKTVKAETNTNQFSRKSSRRPSFSASTDIKTFSSVRLIHHPDTLKQCEL